MIGPSSQKASNRWRWLWQGKESSTPKKKRRRRSRRRCASSAELTRSFDAVCTVRPKGELGPFAASSQRITLGGMFVDAEVLPRIDSQVTIDIVPADGRPLRVQARVVQVRPDRGFGCIFTRISDLSEACLTRWLGHCGGMLPVSGEIEA